MIDVNFDFTTDSPRYWDNFWKDEILGGGGYCDPDAKSKTLQKYHQILWSRELPCGKTMQLNIGSGKNYLTWNEFRFGSDSILASFRYKKYRKMLEEVAVGMDDYKGFIENFIHKSYTIGGTIIFPKANSINRARGVNHHICDRWDLTLECIRRYYQNELSPLYETLKMNKSFFDFFVDFKGYVDFFFLQDLVNDDYTAVKFMIGDGDFSKNPLPQSAEEYLLWIDKQLEFLQKRNERIASFTKTK